MKDIVSRPYATEDRQACLSIFDSNVPAFFALQERSEFLEFLERIGSVDTTYLVLVNGDTVVACGGLTINVKDQQASLSWGMVDRAVHGAGLGTALTRARLALARSIPGINDVVLATSQHTKGFYERFGFAVTHHTPDGFGFGLDRCDMQLALP